VIKAAHLRPDPQLNIEECCIKISVLPIKLNIDQDALLFFYQFYLDVSVKDQTDGKITFVITFHSMLRFLASVQGQGKQRSTAKLVRFQVTDLFDRFGIDI